MKHGVLALAATFVLACGGAAARSPESASQPAPPAAVAEARPFIERSLVIAPEHIDGFSMVHMRDFQGRPDAGVGLRYQHDELPEVLIDLFIYPVGRLERERALEHGMRTTRQEINATAERGAYSALEFDDEQAFDLRTLAVDGSAGAVGAPGPDVGRRQFFRYSREEGPADSLIFMFHRGLFLAKGRASALPEVVPKEIFDRVANLAMAAIVPAIEVRSTGGCSARTIDVDATLEGEALQAQLMNRLLESQRQAEEENCLPTLDETVPAGRRGQLLVFPPSLWQDG